MILLGTAGNGISTPLDSTTVKEEKFAFKIRKEKLPIYLALTLKTNNGEKLLFNFPTNRKFKGSPWLYEYFMRDELIQIYGSLKYFNPRDVQLNTKVKLVYLDSPLIAGEQTFVLYNVSFDFNKPATDSSMGELINLIKKYPYSYYLIDKIYKNRYNYSKQQVKKLLELFDKNIQQGYIAINLRKGLETRKDLNIASISKLELIGKNGDKMKLNFRHHKITMIILWASWCGPCRSEIPYLKKLHTEFNSFSSQFNMISISVDRSKEDWLKAVFEENMPWEQDWVSPKNQDYIRNLFNFSSIPTVLFIDSSNHIIKRITGVDANSYSDYKNIISEGL